MSQVLAERYSQLSFSDCQRALRRAEKGESLFEHGSPLTDLPLLNDVNESFAVPPGVDVSKICSVVCVSVCA